jgi:hypothetical protein
MSKEFDIPYGISTVAITTGGFVVISSKKAFYHGIVYVNTATSPVTITVWDNATTTAGNILDLIRISATTGAKNEKFFPVVAKAGIVVSVSGTANQGMVFYAPKG